MRLTPLTLREKELDLGPNTLDEALAASQRYESNQKVLNIGSAFLNVPRGHATCPLSSPEPPVWVQQIFQQQVEILEKLKNIPKGRQGRNNSVESLQDPRACFTCGGLNHLIRNCPHQDCPDQ